jgi:allantoinase
LSDICATSIEAATDQMKAEQRMDVLITGGTIVTETSVLPADLGISGGRIAAILAPGSARPAAGETIDADGLLILPGAIDAHTHFTGSHEREAEELREGTRGAAAGGVTTILEMPHSFPPATTLAAFLGKRAMGEAESSVDFGLWAGLDGTNLAELAAMDAAGAVAFKGFLCSGDPSGRATDPSGLPALDDDQLLRAMRTVRTFDGLIGLHAENHAMLVGAGAEMRAAGRHDARAHALAGPEIAEIEAVSLVLLLAAETGARCHIVHLSSARAAALIVAARTQVNVTVETCPQYLLLDEEDLVRIGVNARCAPPLRPRPVVDALWRHVLRGDIDMLASDHCPYMPEQKEAGRASIWEAGMGVTGIETSVPLFVGEALGARGLSLCDVARMTATAPAQRFGLADRKGAIRLGLDADLAFYDPAARWTVRGADFRGFGTWSPFEGVECQGRVVRTMLRGTTVYADGRFPVAPGFGQFLAPARPS